MGKAKQLKEKWSKINEQEGVIMAWDRVSGKGNITAGTQSFEVSPELVKSFGDEKLALEGKDCEFTTGTVDGKEMVTSLTVKGAE